MGKGEFKGDGIGRVSKKVMELQEQKKGGSRG